MNAREFKTSSELTTPLEELGAERGMEVGTDFHYWCDGNNAAQHNNGYGASFDDPNGGNHTFSFWVDPRTIID